MNTPVRVVVDGLVNVVLQGGFIVLPERNDNGVVRMFDAAGAAINVDQGAVRLALVRLGLAGDKCGGIDARQSVHARRYRKFRNDMEWLALLDAIPGACRKDWGAAPFRCTHRGFTEVRDGVERLTPAGAEWLDLYRMPF